MTPLITPIFVYVSLSVCLLMRLLDCFFVCCFNVAILNVFVFLIYSMLKWQNEIVIHFVEGHSSSLNLMTFCQIFHGGYWPACSSFHKNIKMRNFCIFSGSDFWECFFIESNFENVFSEQAILKMYFLREQFLKIYYLREQFWKCISDKYLSLLLTGLPANCISFFLDWLLIED